MKVSLDWLKDFVEIEQTPAEVAEMLTMAGLEVVGLEHKGQGLDNVSPLADDAAIYINIFIEIATLRSQ